MILARRLAARLISTLIAVLAILVGASSTLAAPGTTPSPIQLRTAAATLNVSPIGSASGTAATRTTTPSVFSLTGTASGPRRASPPSGRPVAMGGTVALFARFVAAEDAGALARAPVGRRGSPIEIEPGTNLPGEIGGRPYSGHAFDRMQGRGIPPSAVEEAIGNGASAAGRDGTTVFYDARNNISVVTGRGGNVVTVSYGDLRP